MITLRPAQARGQANFNWLESRRLRRNQIPAPATAVGQRSISSSRRWRCNDPTTRSRFYGDQRQYRNLAV